MTLKEELEILRGEPIEVFTGNALDIPCIETSDAERLCRRPVVSVQMITYNHEPYIRQAIEGVMMQKTDFEFELVIGEDCSQDKTREICFEYQKKYPDKIRVLWWHENVSKLGGNGRRTRARCRGEFIALCEGDDYWTDPQKLQKQVEIMRVHSEVGLCFCSGQELDDSTGTLKKWPGAACFKSGIQIGRDFFSIYNFGRNKVVGTREEGFVYTATLLFRRELADRMRNNYEVFSWKLRLGDKTLILGLASLADVYYLSDVVSVYRRQPNGAMGRGADFVLRDSAVVRMFYALTCNDLYEGKTPSCILRALVGYRVRVEKHSMLEWRKIGNHILGFMRRYQMDLDDVNLRLKIRYFLFFQIGWSKVFEVNKYTILPFLKRK